MPKLIIRHRRRRMVPDLEKEYRRTLGQYMWSAMGLMVLMQLSCLPPLYLFGQFHWLPVAIFPPLIALGYWMFSQPLTQSVESAPPKTYFAALLGGALFLFFLSHYFHITHYLVRITEAESRAKTHLAAIGEVVSATLAAPDPNADPESKNPRPRRLDGDWTNADFFPELPDQYRQHLSKSVIKRVENGADPRDSSLSNQLPEECTTKPPLDGYYYFYDCRPSGSWVVWCESANYPRGGRMLYVLGHKGIMLAREVKGLHVHFKVFPSTLQQTRFLPVGKFAWGVVPKEAQEGDEEEEPTEEESREP